MSRERFQLHEGGGERAKYYLPELQKITSEWQCGIDKKPRWCVYGETTHFGSGVLWWIKPEQGDELVAKRLAKLLNEDGQFAYAEMTEWNEDLKGRAVYETEDHKRRMIEDVIDSAENTE